MQEEDTPADPVQAWEPMESVQVLATTGVTDVEIRGNVDYIVGKYEQMGHHWSRRRPVYKLDRNLVAKSTLYSDYYLHWRDGMCVSVLPRDGATTLKLART
eukprot:m.467181 g.467181  ORF g.467181 m.467181 type:complete len:101 (-) comp21633_c0_seq9:1187-1489(-)